MACKNEKEASIKGGLTPRNPWLHLNLVSSYPPFLYMVFVYASAMQPVFLLPHL